MEEKIKGLIEETVNSLGFNIVQVVLKGSNQKILEILIENKDGNKIEVGDCQLVSKNVSAILDVEDIILDRYFLEVSSAGLERPIVTLDDYKRFCNKEIKIRLKTPINNSSSFRGKLLGVNEDNLIIIKSKDAELSFEFDNIKNGKLVMTDDMFKELLNKNSI
ncbi:MAG TPA: ribosome maturation factor RimP [Candidatus Megaira endosymbiont of Nemacystus decipiens]|nr:ribosome maturation factor RimP [Candidatus Megaera endosymbiont of Nemacystus decipiens]